MTDMIFDAVEVILQSIKDGTLAGEKKLHGTTM